MAQSDDPKINRKAFFTEGIRLVGEATVETASAFLDGEAEGFPQPLVIVRPPGAIDEVRFAERCTGCLDCVRACHQGVILFDRDDPAKLPFLDLVHHKPCYLCNTLPCITACETGALQMPVLSSANPSAAGGIAFAPSQVRLAHVEVVVEHCLAHRGELCTVCLSTCPFPGRAIYFDEDEHPVIVRAHCTGCAMCLHACVARPRALNIV